MPSSRISPPVSGMNPAIMLRMVVLPQPDGPTTDTNSPSFTSNETSCTAVTLAPA